MKLIALNIKSLVQPLFVLFGLLIIKLTALTILLPPQLPVNVNMIIVLKVINISMRPKPVITNDGYCYLHENQCAECKRRTIILNKYCQEHSNSNCQVKDCYKSTPNSRQSNYYIFCSEHAKLYGNSLSNYQQVQEQERIQQETERVERAEQNQLKSLVQQKTSLANPQEVIRFKMPGNNNLATAINAY